MSAEQITVKVEEPVVQVEEEVVVAEATETPVDVEEEKVEEVVEEPVKEPMTIASLIELASLSENAERQLIKEGELIRKARFTKSVPRQVYLLSDFIVLVKDQAVLKQVIDLSTASIASKGKNIVVSTPGRKFTFVAASEQEQSEWSAAISAAIPVKEEVVEVVEEAVAEEAVEAPKEEEVVVEEPAKVSEVVEEPAKVSEVVEEVVAEEPAKVSEVVEEVVEAPVEEVVEAPVEEVVEAPVEEVVEAPVEEVVETPAEEVVETPAVEEVVAAVEEVVETPAVEEVVETPVEVPAVANFLSKVVAAVEEVVETKVEEVTAAVQEVVEVAVEVPVEEVAEVAAESEVAPAVELTEEQKAVAAVFEQLPALELAENAERILIKEGSFSRVTRFASVSRKVFLFNDYLVLAKAGKKTQLKQVISLASTKIAVGYKTKAKFPIVLTTPERTFVFKAVNAEEQAEWSDALKQLCKEEFLRSETAKAMEINAGGEAFLQAALEGNEDLLDKLAASSADGSFQNEEGMTALHLLALAGKVEMIKFLAERGYSLDVTNKDGKTALEVAMSAEEGSERRGSVARALVDGGAVANKALAESVQKGLIDSVSVLIAARAQLESTTEEGKTALHYAGAVGNVDIVQTLINAGANPNARDAEQNTPLHTATGEIAELLVAAGARVNLKNAAGVVANKQLKDRKVGVVVHDDVVCAKENWVADDASKSCQRCAATFGIFKRRHHCRRCGVLSCHVCVSNMSNKGRACNGCFNIMTHKVAVAEEAARVAVEEAAAKVSEVVEEVPAAVEEVVETPVEVPAVTNFLSKVVAAVEEVVETKVEEVTAAVQEVVAAVEDVVEAPVEEVTAAVEDVVEAVEDVVETPKVSEVVVETPKVSEVIEVPAVEEVVEVVQKESEQVETEAVKESVEVVAEEVVVERPSQVAA